MSFDSLGLSLISCAPLPSRLHREPTLFSNKAIPPCWKAAIDGQRPDRNR